jgi:hypothetical protein
MHRFVRRENVKHYRDLLATATSDDERLRIQLLLDEEVKKQKEAGDDCVNPRSEHLKE